MPTSNQELEKNTTVMVVAEKLDKVRVYGTLAGLSGEFRNSPWPVERRGTTMTFGSSLSKGRF